MAWVSASAATSTGSQSSLSSCRSGNVPVIFAVLSISGHASLAFHTPLTLSPANCPTLNTTTRPASRSCLFPSSQILSATHLLLEYPSLDADRVSCEMNSGIDSCPWLQITLATLLQKPIRGDRDLDDCSASPIKLVTPGVGQQRSLFTLQFEARLCSC